MVRPMQPEEVDSNETVNLVPIPRLLFSEYEDRPFKICTRCGESLAHFEEGYRISKVFKADEAIFEYALCVPCLQKMAEESSAESRDAMFEFQFSRLREVEGYDECAYCERPEAPSVVGSPQEYGVAAICMGEQMAEVNRICSPCMDEMSELVSEETRSGWDRFIQENFPGVPADFEPLPMRHTPIGI